MSAQFKVKIKLHISLFLTKYQLQDRESYRYLYLQLIIKQNLVFTKLIHLIFKTQKYVIDSYSLNVCINIINICMKELLVSELHPVTPVQGFHVILYSC